MKKSKRCTVNNCGGDLVKLSGQKRKKTKKGRRCKSIPFDIYGCIKCNAIYKMELTKVSPRKLLRV